jgi:hypothetical protein
MLYDDTPLEVPVRVVIKWLQANKPTVAVVLLIMVSYSITSKLIITTVSTYPDEGVVDMIGVLAAV